MKSIKIFIAITIILISIGPNCKAQYQKLLKGELNPFDTAVAIEINTYREETKKLELGDSLILNLKHEIDLKKIQIDQMYQLKFHLDKTVDLLNMEIKRKNELISNIRKDYDETLKGINNKKFYQKPEFWGALGLVVGLLI